MPWAFLSGGHAEHFGQPWPDIQVREYILQEKSVHNAYGLQI